MSLQDIINTLTTLPKNEITAALAFMGAGVGVAIATQLLRHWKGWTSLTRTVEGHATAWSRFTVTILSYVTSAAGYIMAGGSGPLWATLTKHAAFIFALAHGWYWLTVSPAYKKVMQLLTDAENYRQITAPQPTSTAEPPAGTFPD